MTYQQFGRNVEAIDNIIERLPGISVLDDCNSEKFLGGAFRVNVMTDGTGFDFELDSSGDPVGNTLTDVNSLGIVNTGPNAGNTGDNDHQFVVEFNNGAGATVAFGNVVFGRGIFAEELDRARGLGATNFRVVQREPMDEDECSVVCQRIL